MLCFARARLPLDFVVIVPFGALARFFLPTVFLADGFLVVDVSVVGAFSLLSKLFIFLIRFLRVFRAPRFIAQAAPKVE